jgi:hypothetical protein
VTYPCVHDAVGPDLTPGDRCLRLILRPLILHIEETLNNPDPVVAILRCARCGCVIDCKQSDGIRYVETSAWPKCCGDTMLLLSDNETPTVRFGQRPPSTQF